MGALYSLVWGTPDPALDVPDAATGITPREREVVQATWALVKPGIKAHGMELLINFFTAYPEHQQLFSAFKDIPIEELNGNKKLQAHANSVLYAVTAVVDNLADPECLIEMLLTLGANHGRRHVPEQGFKDLQVVLVELLQTKLGAKMTPQAVEAWNKTLGVAYSVIFKGMSEYLKKEATTTTTTTTKTATTAKTTATSAKDQKQEAAVND